MARNARLLAWDDGMPGSVLRAPSGRLWLRANLAARHTAAATILPTTAQATAASRRSTRVANTTALTIHLVSSLILARTIAELCGMLLLQQLSSIELLVLLEVVVDVGMEGPASGAVVEGRSSDGEAARATHRSCKTVGSQQFLLLLGLVFTPIGNFST